MFFDWADIYQDFDLHPDDLPPIGDKGFVQFDIETQEAIKTGENARRVEGSFSTIITLSKRGNRIHASGNISRYNRPDNLFGFSSLDDVVDSFNQLIRSIHPDLPVFTKCTKLMHLQGEDGSKSTTCSDGAYFTRLDVTHNSAVGKGNEPDYLKALSTQRYRNSQPRLHTNSMAVDWLSARGNAHLIYPSVYCKHNEIDLHQLPKIKRQYGGDSDFYKSVLAVRNYCYESGAIRHEQKLKAEFLRREGFRYYGLFKENDIFEFHEKFIGLDKRIGGNAMSLESISEQLISNQIVESTKAANTTSMYAIEWMMGKRFDLTKSQVKTHRARLRKIGIDIANPCDLSRFSPVKVVSQRELIRDTLQVPSWYQMPKSTNLRLVA